MRSVKHSLIGLLHRGERYVEHLRIRVPSAITIVIRRGRMDDGLERTLYNDKQQQISPLSKAIITFMAAEVYLSILLFSETCAVTHRKISVG